MKNTHIIINISKFEDFIRKTEVTIYRNNFSTFLFEIFWEMAATIFSKLSVYITKDTENNNFYKVPFF